MKFAGILLCLVATIAWGEDQTLPPASERFASLGDQSPDFQRHVLPLASRLGCNGRACHGSFQGQGGFRLSLFGYDFDEDHKALTGGDEPRVSTAAPPESLILRKPTLALDHEGGEHFQVGSWEYHLLLQWIQQGAKRTKEHQLDRLVVEPAEIVIDSPDATPRLRVIAEWEDGSREDVTCLCRFQSNDPAVATVDETGLVRKAGVGDTHAVAFYDNGVATVPILCPTLGEASATSIPPRTRFDALIQTKLDKMRMTPSPPASDEEFLRRVCLDVTGTLPTATQVRAFLSDDRPDKRARIIDELLESPAHAAWWATKLCDFTGNAEQEFDPPFRSQPARQWYEWVRRRIELNTPYDQIVEGLFMGRSREEDESYEAFAKETSDGLAEPNCAQVVESASMPLFWARRNIRANDAKALRVAHAFLGLRLECAQCHKHPFDQWTKKDFDEFALFLAPVNYGLAPDAKNANASMRESLGLAQLKGNSERERLQQLVKEGAPVPLREVFVASVPPKKANKKNAKKNAPKQGRTPRLLGGEEVSLAGIEDPRQPVMDWMRHPDNPYFATAIVNRVWAHYFGVGIIDPPDDLNLANPPSNADLLRELATEFVNSGYNLRWLHRTITNTDAYQRSWVSNPSNAQDERNFSRALVRRLPAEVAVDAVEFATASAHHQEVLSSHVTLRGIERAGTGPAGGPAAYALKLFGQSDRRTTCDCSRNSDPSVVQAVYLQNDRDIAVALDRREGWLQEIAKQTGWPPANAPPPDPAREKARNELANKVKQMEKRLKTLPSDAAEDVRMQLESRLAKQRRQLAKLDGQSPPATVDPAVEASVELGSLVEEVYLRTVSRYPSEQEKSVGVKYLESSESRMQGLRDLLWAMLNTKEFITNH